MDFQKEFELFLDYYMPNQSSDIRDAVELDKSFHVINVPKLLAVSGLDESYVLRLTDSWNAWKAAKAQAVPDGFGVVNQKDLLELTIAINAVDLATHTESKTNEVREMWKQVALKLMVLGTAQEPTND